MITAALLAYFIQDKELEHTNNQESPEENKYIADDILINNDRYIITRMLEEHINTYNNFINNETCMNKLNNYIETTEVEISSISSVGHTNTRS